MDFSTSMPWSERALACVRRLSTSVNTANYLPFLIDGHRCGLVHKEYISQFQKRPELFNVTDSFVKLTESSSKDNRSNVINQFLSKLREEGTFSVLKGWRNETYSVFKDGFRSEILFDVERAAVGIIGCKSYGVHMNGYVHKDGQLMMWVGKRAPNKAKYPGCYDNMVAGGISTGYGVWDTLLKEAEEEASIPADIMSRAKPVGAITYTIVNDYGTAPEVEFVYDLELPLDFVPRNADGEVAGFELMTIDQLKEVVVTDKFKTNCAGVVIDFLIRHGLVQPDNSPEYVEIVNLLHSKHPF